VILVVLLDKYWVDVQLMSPWNTPNPHKKLVQKHILGLYYIIHGQMMFA
jgi:hypothetical protein